MKEIVTISNQTHFVIFADDTSLYFSSSIKDAFNDKAQSTNVIGPAYRACCKETFKL